MTQTEPLISLHELIDRVCGALSCTQCAQRIDVTINRPSMSDDPIETIKLAKIIAQTWNLDTFVGLQGSALKLTFIKQARHADMALSNLGNEWKSM